mmetsp:Transcript_98784/g.205906  ORF Transcript_98784/g.205906 Transcript_98784/m.205906 type:complete len:671 (-) Transcript_98784:143-2155(-)|eukprot:CAMPEP_0206436228 /NCGR_PEP_ID=MMETSP0324_2-20121206/10360_1 /ASSEMBLY_ACC=CAM_ASM_000836 /TAXON_ID=2866 /ORGANISM="Crypthecodinium cohnii, Strain Seligo" /LENGTH=670 /DNA_ID=CAMNT_0053903357 /DNA_START=138 /DNA_END=2150 /DNA_ORIENTATION=-
MAPPARWEILGDADGAPIPVRESNSLTAPALSEKIEKGAIVEEVRLLGEQLHYKLVQGKGPAEGWLLTCTGCRCPIKRFCPPLVEQAKKLNAENEAADMWEQYWITRCAAATKTPVNVKTREGCIDFEEEPEEPPVTAETGVKATKQMNGATPSYSSTSKVEPIPGGFTWEQGDSEVLDIKAMTAERCRAEWQKQFIPWTFVGHQVLMENHRKLLPGMRYGIIFPHSAELLESEKFGARWLTKAFQLAGTIPTDNAVKRLFNVRPVSGGGACLKCSFEVEYEKPAKGLHTKLFMKYPFDFEHVKQKNDRMNSSINLQPGDLAENDAYRLLESALPFPMPKYYFGDINNSTTNFVLITELIPFGSKKKKMEDFQPDEVEPAYDKFLDDEQLSNPIEYYRLMTKANATMAGWYKAGKLGDKERMLYFFFDQSQVVPPSFSEAEFKSKLKMGEEFVRSATTFFPANLITDKNMTEWKRVLNIVNTYKPEIYQAASSNDDYCSVAHGNLNVDNTWWWRDAAKELHVGVLDWGGLGKVCLPHKLWWSFYSCELHLLEGHLEELLDIFVDTYATAGGPRLDKKVVRRDFMFAALDQMLGLLGAIPAVYRVIPKKAWTNGEVKDRNDNRLRDNFLTRMYVMGVVLVTRMIFAFDLGALCDDFVKDLPAGKKKKLATL